MPVSSSSSSSRFMSPWDTQCKWEPYKRTYRQLVNVVPNVWFGLHCRSKLIPTIKSSVLQLRAGLTQWQDHSSSTNNFFFMSWVRFSDLSSELYGLSLLVLHSALSSFSSGTPVFPSHQKPTFDLICCDSVWFVVSSISKDIVVVSIHWDLNKVITIETPYFKYRQTSTLIKLTMFHKHNNVAI